VEVGRQYVHFAWYLVDSLLYTAKPSVVERVRLRTVKDTDLHISTTTFHMPYWSNSGQHRTSSSASSGYCLLSSLNAVRRSGGSTWMALKWTAALNQLFVSSSVTLPFRLLDRHGWQNGLQHYGLPTAPIQSVWSRCAKVLHTQITYALRNIRRAVQDRDGAQTVV
jgi:hypothetical protein